MFFESGHQRVIASTQCEATFEFRRLNLVGALPYWAACFGWPARNDGRERLLGCFDVVGNVPDVERLDYRSLSAEI
jgi:hypothetical protein